MTRKEIEEPGQRALKEKEVTVRNFLKRKVGRRLIAILFGKPDKPNFPRADSYLYKGVKRSATCRRGLLTSLDILKKALKG